MNQRNPQTEPESRQTNIARDESPLNRFWESYFDSIRDGSLNNLRLAETVAPIQTEGIFSQIQNRAEYNPSPLTESRLREVVNDLFQGMSNANSNWIGMDLDNVTSDISPEEIQDLQELENNLDSNEYYIDGSSYLENPLGISREYQGEFQEGYDQPVINYPDLAQEAFEVPEGDRKVGFIGGPIDGQFKVISERHSEHHIFIQPDIPIKETKNKKLHQEKTLVIKDGVESWEGWEQGLEPLEAEEFIYKVILFRHQGESFWVGIPRDFQEQGFLLEDILYQLDSSFLEADLIPSGVSVRTQSRMESGVRNLSYNNAIMFDTI